MHLNVRSSYSLLSGLMHVSTIAQKAQEASMRAVALTDFHVLYGALNFQIECQKRGIKPLFGMDITLDGGGLVSALAKDIEGYQSLIKLSYELSVHPTISLETLRLQADDLVVIAHGEGGPFEQVLANEDYETLRASIQTYKESFPTFYIGISHQESPYFLRINKELVNCAKGVGVECVAMTKVLYGAMDDADTYRIVRAIDKGTYFEDKTLVSAPNRHFLSVETMHDLYDSQLLKPIDAIIDMCNVDLFALKSDLPHFPIAADVSADVYLQKLSQFGLKKRLQGRESALYQERLAYELNVINTMGFTDYFLIVYDVIRYAKKEGIYVGPGRGSSAGSLVAYSLGITDVDPIHYDLLFERFLNPKRISMPDIDIDFPDNKRDQVIHYVRSKYGDAYVGHIVTFGTMKAKQSFRDVSRVFQVPIRFVDTVAKLITADSLKENFDNVVKFRTAIMADKTLKRVYDAALRVEGLLRHSSIHPAGIVVSQKPLLDVVPVAHEGEGLNVIQYDMMRLESLGLIKIDFLGLRNLTIIDEIVGVIRKHDPTFKITEIPLDDRTTLAMLAKGETIGVFQLESDGMKSLMKRMKPYRFMDVVDAIALYRPGPMENIPLYLKSRLHPETVQYLHPDLEKITSSTYGVLVYQEQISAKR